MGNNKKSEDRSRRSFISLFLSGNSNSPAKETGKPEMVKMLTAEGKLVEVEKNIVDKASKKQKSTNKEIFHWMKNPSKDNS